MILEIIFLVVAILGIYEGVRLSGTVLLFADSVGPGWYLFLMSCLLFACMMALMMRRFVRRKTDAGEVGISLHTSTAGRGIMLMVLYVVSLKLLGYIIASTIFFILVQRIFGERSWIRCTVVGVSITACFYLVFVYLAGVPLP